MGDTGPDWVKVYTSSLPHKVNIVKAVLDDNQIPSMEVDRKDSTYTFMGEVELYVHKENMILAEFIIKSNDL